MPSTVWLLDTRVPDVNDGHKTRPAHMPFAGRTGRTGRDLRPGFGDAARRLLSTAVVVRILRRARREGTFSGRRWARPGSAVELRRSSRRAQGCPNPLAPLAPVRGPGSCRRACTTSSAVKAIAAATIAGGVVPGGTACASARSSGDRRVLTYNVSTSSADRVFATWPVAVPSDRRRRSLAATRGEHDPHAQRRSILPIVAAGFDISRGAAVARRRPHPAAAFAISSWLGGRPHAGAGAIRSTQGTAQVRMM
jgi:hypothetical protein